MIKSILLATTGVGLMFLTSCGGGTTTAPVSSSASVPPVATSAKPAAEKKPEKPMAETEKKAGSGIVVESGAYHLELVPEKEDDVTHLDLFLQQHETHESVPNAKVTAQVQLPDGSQQSVDMAYDATAKHYTGKLQSVAPGEYKVTVQSTIGSEKVNARYTFKQ
jgi:hypothetical protein